MLEIRDSVGRRVSDGSLLSALDSLPLRLANEILVLSRRFVIEEIRVRARRRASVVASGKNVMLGSALEPRELTEILGKICKGSLYAYSETINRGYVALEDGLRVGVCGHAACEGGRIIGVHDVTSLAIRIPHPTLPIGERVCRLLLESDAREGVLVYAPPGVGKTTLLRAVAARLSSGESPLRTVVIDTRGELSFGVGAQDLCLDVLSGYPRREGIEIATRSLNAQLIICDEIGDYEEAMALVSSHNCGVPLVASAHAASVRQLLSRTGIRLLHEAGIFGSYVGLSRAGNMDFNYDVCSREQAQKEAICL